MARALTLTATGGLAFEKRAHKFSAKPVRACTVCCQVGDGLDFCRRCGGKPMKFASTREYARFCQLKLAEKAGAISQLELQPRFALVVNHIKVATYVGDFRYVEGGKSIVEDVKGAKTLLYSMKKKLMKAVHGIDVLETK